MTGTVSRSSDGFFEAIYPHKGVRVVVGCNGGQAMGVAGGRAAEVGNLESMRVMMEMGADPRADNGTALHQTAFFGQAAAVEFLLGAGVPVNVNAGRGRSRRRSPGPSSTRITTPRSSSYAAAPRSRARSRRSAREVTIASPATSGSISCWPTSRRRAPGPGMRGSRARKCSSSPSSAKKAARRRRAATASSAPSLPAPGAGRAARAPRSSFRGRCSGGGELACSTGRTTQDSSPVCMPHAPSNAPSNALSRDRGTWRRPRPAGSTVDTRPRPRRTGSRTVGCGSTGCGRESHGARRAPRP